MHPRPLNARARGPKTRLLAAVASLLRVPALHSRTVRSVELVEVLLDHGAEMNALSFGWSALHAAAAKPDRRMVELLLRRGADPFVRADVKSPLGEEHNHPTPLELLVGFRQSRDLLRKAGAKVDNVRRRGFASAWRRRTGDWSQSQLQALPQANSGAITSMKSASVPPSV